ncbi:polysaccharide biosynthesis tyrosine autokinase [Pararhizobium antarcticum]|uniref:polysaccharide biosynthesis tyrosine autokinase n=1 Tax=Pararhizobium antarcticum TaxID=1798805 RepID=UPI001FD8F745|nr:polysaccharide biosynthesis tyrosine autokinase [Pararhizobium antarcticum]
MRERRDFSAEEQNQTVDFDKLLGAARRQWKIVLVAAVVAVLLGAAYALSAVPLYTASSTVLIDRQNSAVVDQLSTIAGGVDDEASVLSQIELLKSDTIGLAVVDKLGLVDNPEFNASTESPLGTVLSVFKSIVNVPGWFASSSTDIADINELKRRSALSTVLGNVGVSRVGRTYVISISYTSASPTLSASIAGGIADAYLTDKLDSKYDATRRASTWLQDRIEELKQKSLESDLAVQKFRTSSGLLTSDGRLVSDQQLTELNSAMIVAQADTAKAQAKFDRIRSIIANGQNDAIVSEVLDSSISNNLREKYLEASKREAEIADRLGTNHSQAVRLRGEMREYERLMFEELNRIAESYQSELDVSKSREKSLASSVALASGVSALAGETQVQLRELERSAETYKNLYQTFLQRYQEAIQQQSFPITEARIISRATPPQGPSHPRKSLILALSLIMGCAAGAGIGAFREFRDRFFRTGEQVREVLGVEYLGHAPLVASTDRKAAEIDAESTHPRSIRKASPIYNHAIDHPLSAFAETLRSAKIAADLNLPGKGSKIIGVVSILPGEGKSTVSINFAELLANQGARTVLIDADLRNPGATRALGKHADAGLLEAVLEQRPVRDMLLMNAKTKLAFLPAVVKRRIPHSSELLSSLAMSQVLSEVSANADYVVVDLPPLGPVVDARAIASKIDGFIFVVEWGRTARSIVKQTLENEPLIAAKCLGVILNKVDEDKLKLYKSYGSSEYYYSRYSAYYREG